MKKTEKKPPSNAERKFFFPDFSQQLKSANTPFWLLGEKRGKHEMTIEEI